MCGSATLAMLVSSTSMNVASVTVSAMIQGLTAGRQCLVRIPSCGRGAHFTSTFGFDRHSRAQQMVIVRAWIQHDLHGQTLHNLHVVAGRILRRKQAESRAARAGDTVHLPFVFSAVGVHRNLNRLPRAHVPQLSFFEICGDPHVFERHDRQQLLSRLHVHSYLYVLVYDAGDGRNDRAVLQI